MLIEVKYPLENQNTAEREVGTQIYMQIRFWKVSFQQA